MTRLTALAVLAAVTANAVADPPKAPPSERGDGVREAVRLVTEGTPPDRLRAVRTLKELGPKGAAAIPALVEVAREHRREEGAAPGTDGG